MKKLRNQTWSAHVCGGFAFLAAFKKGIEVTTQIVSVWYLVCCKALSATLLALGKDWGKLLLICPTFVEFFSVFLSLKLLPH